MTPQQQPQLDPNQVRDQVISVINEAGMPPYILVELGQLAEDAINDKSKKAYKKYVDYMVERGMETREDLKKPDYQFMAMMVAMGKVAAQMPESRPVPGPVAPQGL